MVMRITTIGHCAIYYEQKEGGFMAMQPYMVLIGSVIVPVTPSEITTKYSGKNKTVELVDGTIINKLNPSELTTYKFTLLLHKQTKGITVFIVEQYLDFVLGISDYIYVMEKGSIVLDGKTSDLKLRMFKK